VGYYAETNDASEKRTLALHWNGSSWSKVSTPVEGSEDNLLNGVSCTSSTNCIAAGYRVSNPKDSSLSMRWDGEKWTQIAATTVVKGGEDAMRGVSCVATTDCFAAGVHTTSLWGPYRTLAERWQGEKWAVLSTPNAE
jgi:hypothetical protein